MYYISVLINTINFKHCDKKYNWTLNKLQKRYFFYTNMFSSALQKNTTFNFTMEGNIKMPPYILGLAMAVLNQLYYKLWNICSILSLDYLVGPLPKDNVVGPLPDPNIVRINYTTTCNRLKLCFKFYIILRLSCWLLFCWLLPENNIGLCPTKYSKDIQLYTTAH